MTSPLPQQEARERVAAFELAFNRRRAFTSVLWEVYQDAFPGDDDSRPNYDDGCAALCADLRLLLDLPQPTGKDAELVALAGHLRDWANWLAGLLIERPNFVLTKLLGEAANTIDRLSTLTAELEGAQNQRDAAYVKMIDTAGALRGYGDVCEVAARALVGAVPEDFDDREEEVRAAIATDHQPSKEETR